MLGVAFHIHHSLLIFLHSLFYLRDIVNNVNVGAKVNPGRAGRALLKRLQILRSYELRTNFSDEKRRKNRVLYHVNPFAVNNKAAESSR